jgi:septin 3/9/12
VVEGKPVRGRETKWGVIDGKLCVTIIRRYFLIPFLFLVENESHCEFVLLRNFLTRTHLQDLIETTSQIHYETFRAKQLLALKENTAPNTGSLRPSSPYDRESVQTGSKGNF